MKNKTVRFFALINREDGSKQKVFCEGVVKDKIIKDGNTLYLVKANTPVYDVSVFILDPLDIEMIDE